MGEIGDLLYEAMDDMYRGLIEEGATPEEARQRVDEVDWANYNPFEVYAAEAAFWGYVEGGEQRPPKGGAKRRHSRAAAAALPADALAALLQLQPALIQGQSAGLRLTIELVPSTSWGKNMPDVVSRRMWDQIRMAACRASGDRCAICGAQGRLSCHEHWAYDDQTATQTLLGLLALCTMCHLVKHIGRAGQLARAGVLDYEALVKHFMAVNDCDEATFKEHLTQARGVWRRRSTHPWTVDLGPYAAIATAKGESQ